MDRLSAVVSHQPMYAGATCERVAITNDIQASKTMERGVLRFALGGVNHSTISFTTWGILKQVTS